MLVCNDNKRIVHEHPFSIYSKRKITINDRENIEDNRDDEEAIDR